jgi:hypothetical protein
MSRNHEHRTSRPTSWIVSSTAALAATLGAALFAAPPASADHVEGAVAHHVGRVAASHFLLAGEIFFGHPPVVEVHHHRVAPPPHIHRHHASCGHGHGHHARHDRKHARHHAHHAPVHRREVAFHGGHPRHEQRAGFRGRGLR